MNTRFTLLLPGIEKNIGEEICNEIKKIVLHWEHKLSRFLKDSEVSNINLKAKVEWVRCSNEIADVIRICEKYHNLTYSYFDPTYSKIYDILNSKIPLDDKELEKFVVHCGWDKVKWDENKQSVRFLTKYVQLDFGGVGKGIAQKHVIDYLKGKGIDSAFICFGESSLAAIGKHPYGNSWPVRITGCNSNISIEFSIIDECISVSGMQKRNELLKPHIYNPKKHKLINKLEYSIVKTVCPIEAEILSTAGYVADKEVKSKMKKTFPYVDFEWIVSEG